MSEYQSVLERVAHIMSRRYRVNISFAGDRVVLTKDGLILPGVQHEKMRDLLEVALDRGVSRLAFSEDVDAIKKRVGSLREKTTRTYARDVQAVTHMAMRLDAARAEKCLGKEFIGSEMNLKEHDRRREVELRGVEPASIPAWFYVAEEIEAAYRGKPPVWPEMEGPVKEKLLEVVGRIYELHAMEDTLDMTKCVNDLLEPVLEYFPEEPIPPSVSGKTKGKGEGEGGGGRACGEGGGKGQGEGETEMNTGEAQKGREDGEGEGEGESGSNPAQALGGTSGAGRPLKLGVGLDGELNKINSEVVKSMLADNKEYRVKTKEFDVVLDHTKEGNPRLYADLLRRVHTVVAPTQRKLERAFQVEMNARWKLEREQGALSPQTMHKVRTDPAYRTPFQQYTQKDLTKEIAVTILGDVSGSMGGERKIPLQQETFLVLGKVLFKLGIPFELLTFTTIPQEYTAASWAQEEKGGRRWNWWTDPEERAAWLGASTKRLKKTPGNEYGRTDEGLKHIILKSFQNPGHNLKAITTMRPDNQNADGESIMWAADRLRQYNAKRRILLVTSDGHPAVDGDNNSIVRYTEKVVKEVVPKMGIDIVGIGIASDQVRHFYDKHIVITKIDQMPKRVADLLVDMLDPTKKK